MLGAGTPAVVKYGITLGQAVNLLLVGQNQPVQPPDHGASTRPPTLPLPAFPRVTDDYQFLSSSTIAKVTPGASNQVVAGTGLGLLHAYDGVTGLDAPGFPKVTGGWLFAPAALDDAGTTAAITREGYLFQWETEQPECQPDGVWPSYRHDDHGSGNTATDGVAPGTPADATLTPAGDGKWTLDFTAPGDDALCGTPDGYAAARRRHGRGRQRAGRDRRAAGRRGHARAQRGRRGRQPRHPGAGALRARGAGRAQPHADAGADGRAGRDGDGDPHAGTDRQRHAVAPRRAAAAAPARTPPRRSR